MNRGDFEDAKLIASLKQMGSKYSFFDSITENFVRV